LFLAAALGAVAQQPGTALVIALLNAWLLLQIFRGWLAGWPRPAL
jgi:hypothetical protein